MVLGFLKAVFGSMIYGDISGGNGKGEGKDEVKKLNLLIGFPIISLDKSLHIDVNQKIKGFRKENEMKDVKFVAFKLGWKPEKKIKRKFQKIYIIGYT